jgi:hypothetical protein
VKEEYPLENSRNIDADFENNLSRILEVNRQKFE